MPIAYFLPYVTFIYAQEVTKLRVNGVLSFIPFLFYNL